MVSSPTLLVDVARLFIRGDTPYYMGQDRSGQHTFAKAPDFFTNQNSTSHQTSNTSRAIKPDKVFLILE